MAMLATEGTLLSIKDSVAGFAGESEYLELDYKNGFSYNLESGELIERSTTTAITNCLKYGEDFAWVEVADGVNWYAIIYDEDDNFITYKGTYTGTPNYGGAGFGQYDGALWYRFYFASTNNDDFKIKRLNAVHYNANTIVMEDGNFVFYNTGLESESPSYCSSDFIEIPRDRVHTQIFTKNVSGGNAAYLCFYDKDKTFISGFRGGDISVFNCEKTIPDNAVYIKICAMITNKETFDTFIAIPPKAPRPNVSEILEDIETSIKEVSSKNYNTHRVFHSEKTNIISETPTTVDTISNVNNPFLLDGIGMYSLRIINSLTDADDNAVEINMVIYDDRYISDGSYLFDADGNQIKIVLPGNAHYIITPDDIPQLKYLNHLKVGVSPRSVPSSGSIEVWVVTKS